MHRLVLLLTVLEGRLVSTDSFLAPNSEYPTGSSLVTRGHYFGPLEGFLLGLMIF